MCSSRKYKFYSYIWAQAFQATVYHAAVNTNNGQHPPPLIPQNLLALFLQIEHVIM